VVNRLSAGYADSREILGRAYVLAVVAAYVTYVLRFVSLQPIWLLEIRTRGVEDTVGGNNSAAHRASPERKARDFLGVHHQELPQERRDCWWG
jgi:hypothetical protein